MGVARKKTELAKPADDLRDLGEKLQQALILTKARLPYIEDDLLKRRAAHAVDRAHDMFHTMSTTVQTIERMKHFLEQGFGLDVDDIFAMTGKNEAAARVSTHSAMVLVNQGISTVLADLTKVNAAIDREVAEHDKKKT
jgi:hypothetical protein